MTNKRRFSSFDELTAFINYAPIEEIEQFLKEYGIEFEPGGQES